MELSIKIEGKPIADRGGARAGARLHGLRGHAHRDGLSGQRARILDLELGRRLGYDRPRKIRDLIKSLVAGGFLVFDDQRFAAKRSPRTAEYWLTEEQALFVTTQAPTPTARAITLQVIRAFIAARHALNKPVLDQKLVERIELAVGPLLDAYKLLDKRLGRLESGGGFSMRPMLLVPQVDPEDAGYSMAGVIEALTEKGYSIAKTTAPRADQVPSWAGAASARRT